MDFQRLCANLKEKVAADLQGASNPLEKSDILIAALYELDRSVLPKLGTPRKSEEYLQKQAAAVDLITCLAIPLIRNAENDGRGVAVLSEVGQSCPDPLLQKKLSVYAQELLAKSQSRAVKSAANPFARIFFLIGMTSLCLILLYHAWPSLRGPRASGPPSTAAAPEPEPAPAQAKPATQFSPVVSVAVESAAPREKVAEEPKTQEKSAAQEQVTRVRVISSQVLVPVLLKSGSESVRVELVLDTGASRTAIHEGVASRLRIDLKNAKLSQSELADGRVVTSKIARLDGLYVGPFGMPALEVEVIPYKGADGIHDGLLGMDFLGKHRYQIDMEREVIRWF